MASNVQINAAYTNGRPNKTVKTLYLPTAEISIREYPYAAGGHYADNSMYSIITHNAGKPHPVVYYSAQTVSSLMSAINA